MRERSVGSRGGGRQSGGTERRARPTGQGGTPTPGGQRVGGGLQPGQQTARWRHQQVDLIISYEKQLYTLTQIVCFCYCHRPLRCAILSTLLSAQRGRAGGAGVANVVFLARPIAGPNGDDTKDNTVGERGRTNRGEAAPRDTGDGLWPHAPRRAESPPAPGRTPMKLRRTFVFLTLASLGVQGQPSPPLGSWTNEAMPVR